jgi:hypothetical protein
MKKKFMAIVIRFSIILALVFQLTFIGQTVKADEDGRSRQRTTVTQCTGSASLTTSSGIHLLVAGSIIVGGVVTGGSANLGFTIGGIVFTLSASGDCGGGPPIGPPPCPTCGNSSA